MATLSICSSDTADLLPLIAVDQRFHDLLKPHLLALGVRVKLHSEYNLRLSGEVPGTDMSVSLDLSLTPDRLSDEWIGIYRTVTDVLSDLVIEALGVTHPSFQVMIKTGSVSFSTVGRHPSQYQVAQPVG